MQPLTTDNGGTEMSERKTAQQQKAPAMSKIAEAHNKKRMTESFYTEADAAVNGPERAHCAHCGRRVIRLVRWLVRDGGGRRIAVSTTHTGLLSLLREGFLGTDAKGGRVCHG